MSSETKMPKTIFEVVKYLCNANVFSPEPENIAIIREERQEIFPCARAYPSGLDLGQLEWAAKTGNFWFLGPVKGIRVIIDEGPLRGKLFLGLNNMTHETTLNTLNFTDFRKVINQLKIIAIKEGLKIKFHEPQHGYYNVDLTVTYETSLSVENVNKFLAKLRRIFSVCG